MAIRSKCFRTLAERSALETVAVSRRKYHLVGQKADLVFILPSSCLDRTCNLRLTYLGW